MNNLLRTLLLTFTCAAQIRTAEIGTAPERDIQILRLQLLFQIHENCSTEKNVYMRPFCNSMQALADQLGIFLERGTLPANEIIIPVINTLNNELQNLKEAASESDFELQSGPNEKEDPTLHEKIKQTLDELQNPETIDRDKLRKKLEEIVQQHNNLKK